MAIRISPRLCLRCKGRLLCGERSCRVLDKYARMRETTSKMHGTSFSGSSPPSVFVSWHSYPKITLSPLSPPEVLDFSRAEFLDNPERWFGLPSSQIVSCREQLIRGSTTFDAADAASPNRALAEVQELAMSASPVDVDVELSRRPEAKLSFSDSSPPMGPSAPLKKLNLVQNPDIPTKVDYLVGDTDAKSATAMLELYEHNLPVHYLYKILSAGLLGVKKNRKLVPTRWAITAADSNISNVLVDRIRSYRHLSEIQLFRSSYLDNHFYVLLVPGAWAFEQLEAWSPGSSWAGEAKNVMISADHEFYRGRTTYADNVTGAYYSARLAVAEYLEKKRRQASCIIFREIGGQDDDPLGVWVIRQTMRDALGKRPLAFSGISLALAYISTKLSVPMQAYRKKSALLDSIKNQKRISEWF